MRRLTAYEKDQQMCGKLLSNTDEISTAEELTGHIMSIFTIFGTIHTIFIKKSFKVNIYDKMPMYWQYSVGKYDLPDCNYQNCQICQLETTDK